MQTGEWEIRGFFSYFGHRVSFLLAPRTRKKRALTVAAFTVILILEIYIYLTCKNSVIILTCIST